MDNKSILAMATRGKKEGVPNEDSHISLDNHFPALVLADGLGSYTHAQEASGTAIEIFSAELQKAKEPSNLDFPRVFQTAQEKLVQLAKDLSSPPAKDALYATTLIALVETVDKVKMAYLGNGAIWHIRTRFLPFPDIYPLPWVAVNLLNPHSIPQGGKEALYGLLANDIDTLYPPTEIDIKKDVNEGDIFVVCTDGIYSEDQRQFGTNSKGAWYKCEEKMQALFKALNDFLRSEKRSNKTLEEELKNYLKKISIDDDATVGVLITKEALAYSSKLHTESKAESKKAQAPEESQEEPEPEPAALEENAPTANSENEHEPTASNSDDTTSKNKFRQWHTVLSIIRTFIGRFFNSNRSAASSS